MARRKSGWQQFADNFNSTYGTFTKIAGDWESRDIMGEEAEEIIGEGGLKSYKYNDKTYTAEEFTPDFKRGLQYDRLSSSMAKFGDTKGAMDMRMRAEDITSKREENKINREIRDELIYQRGIGKSDTVRGNIDNVASNTAVNIENVTDSKDKRVERQEFRQPKLDKLNAEVSQTKANIEKIKADTSMSETNRKIKLDKLVPELEILNAQAEQQELKYITDFDNYQKDKPLNEALIQFGKNAGNYKTDKEAADAFFGIYSKFQPDVAQAMRLKYTDGEIKTIVQDGEKNSKEIQHILSDPKQGIPGIVRWIDYNNGINSGAKLITKDDGTLALVATDEKTGEVTNEIVTGANEAELSANLQLFTTPGGATKLAAQMLDFKKTKSETGLNIAKSKNEVSKDRDHLKELNIKSMTEFTKDPSGVYQRALSRAQKSNTQADWNTVAQIERDHQELLNRAGSNNGGLKGNQVNPENGGFSGMRKKTN
jgi:hypothetical protein